MAKAGTRTGTKAATRASAGTTAPGEDAEVEQAAESLRKVHRDIQAPVEAVMDVLGDGWLYASWVVGASHIRAVDSGWPKPGARIHHAVGAWPVLVRDYTECLEYDPTGLLVLRARAWPVGEALIRLEVSPVPGGCRVVMGERSLRGPARLLRPVEPLLLAPRNLEALHRLAALARGRAGD